MAAYRIEVTIQGVPEFELHLNIRLVLAGRVNDFKLPDNAESEGRFREPVNLSVLEKVSVRIREFRHLELDRRKSSHQPSQPRE